MAQVLIVYGTREGHTAVVADHLRRPLESAGHVVRVCSIDDAPTCPIGYDLVLIGSSVHQGHHPKALSRWIKGNAEQLNRLASGFFQVSLSSAGTGGGPEAAQQYVDNLIQATGWRPGVTGCFAGALRYSRYGLVKRSMVRSIAQTAGLDTDVHQDYDYTDYRAVARFARDAEALLHGVAPHASV